MNKKDLIHRLREELAVAKSQRELGKQHPDTLAARMALKQYQSQRLAHTHADLLAHPNTHPAAVFFLDELYGARDLTQRDSDVERIIPTLERLMPYHTLETITNAIVLDALSETMDTLMSQRLGINFSEADYIAAYREQTSMAQRQQQIELIESLGSSLCHLVRIPFLATTLVMMRGPAKMAKLSNLQNFLERGFTTFKAMKQPQAFVQKITERELEISCNIYAGRADPFRL
jgi:hypothetical protein